jgi:hypothetical protein
MLHCILVLVSQTAEDKFQKAIYLLYNIAKEYNFENATKQTKVFGFVGTDTLRTKIIINDETLDQVRRRGTTQKKAHYIYNTAKVWKLQ